MPNYIHSFDSSLIIQLFNDTEFNINTIHDCFGCHPNNMNLLRTAVLKAFAQIYTSQDNLNKFHEDNKDIIRKSGYEILVNDEKVEYIMLDDRKIKYLPTPPINNPDYLNK
jgi:DNA-directed RNA polymerase